MMLPLVEELLPCPDPWEVAQKLSHLPHLLFLDSSDRHPERGRYSYVMADPVAFESYRTETFNHIGEEPFAGNGFPCGFLYEKLDLPEYLPPFRGGLAGMWGYGLSRRLETIHNNKFDDFGLEDFAVGLYDVVIAFDHQQNRAWIISSGFEHGFFMESEARIRLDSIKYGLNKKPEKRQAWSAEPRQRIPNPINNRLDEQLSSNFSRADYLKAVAKCIDYIAAGDTFQINLSQRLTMTQQEDPLVTYTRLRTECPSPFGCYFHSDFCQILSASPERFLKVDADRTISTKPIKGTRRRGKTPEEDAALIRDLITNPKDRAENVMIVDLLRNDIGKVAEFGSVSVPRVCEVETYNYVHHLVSEVRGKLRADKTPFDLLKAAFPGGSVTGAPKVRAMEIIAELEPTARGPYCGSIGFIGFDGVMDTNILIRTITAANGWLQFPVGGGIVADSDPEAEYQETLTKAQGLLNALRPT